MKPAVPALTDSAARQVSQDRPVPRVIPVRMDSPESEVCPDLTDRMAHKEREDRPGLLDHRAALDHRGHQV